MPLPEPPTDRWSSIKRKTVEAPRILSTTSPSVDKGKIRARKNKPTIILTITILLAKVNAAGNFQRFSIYLITENKWAILSQSLDQPQTSREEFQRIKKIKK